MTSDQVLALFVAVLTATPTTTDAGARVYAPGDWPTQSGQYPILKLRLASESRQSLGRSGAPQFTTTAVIQITGEAAALGEANNAGAVRAQASLWTLKRQVEIAIIGSYPLTSLIQQIASTDTSTGFDSTSGQHLAALAMNLSVEFYEGPENFAPVDADDIDKVDISVSTYPSLGLTASLNP